MAVVAANVLQAQIEKVRPKVEELFETSDTIAALIKKGGESEVISHKLYRIPIVTRRGGSFRFFNADGGDMGLGSGLSVTNLESGFFYSDYVVELTKQAMDETAKSEQSVLNAFSYNFKGAMKELQAMDDQVFHTNGTGELTNASSATGTWTGGTTYTFAAAIDDVGASRLRPGNIVSVYNTAGTVQRTGTAATVEFQIDHIDFNNKIVYLNDTVTGAAVGDLFAVADLAVTLASFQSTWPLSGDSFRHGLYYFNDANSANYCLGQLKSTVTELLANNVNAGGALAHVHGLQLQDQLINRRDESVYKGLVGLAHMAQRTAVYQLGIAVTEWMRTKQSEGMIDVMPSGTQYSDTFPFVGITHKLDKRQGKSRIDYIIPKKWGRSMLHDTKFHEVEGRTIFEKRTTTGTVQAALQFILVQCFDYYCVDPGSQGFISGLTYSGY